MIIAVIATAAATLGDKTCIMALANWMLLDSCSVSHEGAYWMLLVRRSCALVLPQNVCDKRLTTISFYMHWARHLMQNLQYSQKCGSFFPPKHLLLHFVSDDCRTKFA